MESAVSRAANNADRLVQIETLLLAHPEGLTQAEIARRLQVNRSIISRYLPDLPTHIHIVTVS
jgi:CRISPR-associated endonuclease/helicase Cas3